ncbi:MAG: antibiotic biosynthesis monooxygenase family protein [Acidimicrobiales bacterium]
MAIIKINALTVPEESGQQLAERFAARAGAVDGQEGFEGFELLRPTDGRSQWLVLTRWRDEAAFEAWLQSPSFREGHAGLRREAQQGETHPTISELWSYEVIQSSESPSHS